MASLSEMAFPSEECSVVKVSNADDASGDNRSRFKTRPPAAIRASLNALPRSVDVVGLALGGRPTGRFSGLLLFSFNAAPREAYRTHINAQ